MTSDVVFVLDAHASSDVLPRVLQPLVRRDLVPHALSLRRDGAMVHVEFAVSAVRDEDARLVAGNLRQIVGVVAVHLTCLDPADRRTPADA